MSIEMQKEPFMNTIFKERGTSFEEHIAWYHHMQETQPVHYRPEHNLWEVFRYKDVQQVLLDHTTFSIKKSHPKAFPGVLTKTDPPQHRRLRSLVSKAFTQRRIEELTQRIIEISDELLAPAMTSGKINVVTELAYLLPGRVVAEMLGLPSQDQDRFRQWSYHLLSQLLGASNTDNNEPVQYFSDLLNERKRAPRNDLISALLAAEENGACLTREEVISLCLEILMAGNVTTAVLMSFAFRRLCQQPEIYQTLRDDSTLIPGALEEILRYDFPSSNLWRIACHDTVLNGQEIKADQYVVVWTEAANFDKEYFPHPEQFDPRRSPNPHLTFGHGVHLCLGYPLARLEGRIVLERTVAHFSEIHLDPENPAQFMEHMGAGRMLQSLDILCTPGGRI